MDILVIVIDTRITKKNNKETKTYNPNKQTKNPEKTQTPNSKRN